MQTVNPSKAKTKVDSTISRQSNLLDRVGKAQVLLKRTEFSLEAVVLVYILNSLIVL